MPQATLSRPIEELIGATLPEEDQYCGGARPIDVLIVGSGYGGSIAAMRLAGQGRRVVLLERGREYALGEFPVGLGDLPAHVRFHRHADRQRIGYPDALFDLHIGRDMDVLVGSGLGGTSLINANVAAEPAANVLGDAIWPAEVRGTSLDPHFDRVRKLLGITQYPRTEKYTALERFARQLQARCEPAPIAVTVAGTGPAPNDPVENAVGVPQTPCTGCGNCITGCNVGAKNTLMMNLLPLAAARAAELYTGASVLTVHCGSRTHPWTVRFRRTRSEKTPLEAEVYSVQARLVILAAGSLGSTEILLRSRDRHALPLSRTLGTRFSGNGDQLAMSYGQDKRVGAMASNDQHAPLQRIGPTITGIAWPEKDGAKFTLEDGAIPASLRRVFAETMATASMVHRLGDTTLPAWHRGDAGRDPLSASNEACEHTQVMLLMGDDEAHGELQLQPLVDDLHDARKLVVEWRGVGANPTLVQGGRMLAEHDRKDGFDGGQYVPNPLWQMVPAGAEATLGAVPGGRAISVHPLGGCPMGDHIDTGVVDHRGQVFGADNVYVLDGAIVPRSLGTNPFLTIAALADRAAGLILDAEGWIESPMLRVTDVAESIRPPAAPAPAATPEPIVLHLKERMFGTIERVPGPLVDSGIDYELLRRLTGDRGMVIEVEMNPPDFEDWLEKGPAMPLPATVTLSTTILTPEQTRYAHLDHSPEVHLLKLASGTGNVWLLEPHPPFDALERTWRAMQAFMAYLLRRVVHLPGGGKRDWKELVHGFIEIARMHADWRRMRYKFDLHLGGKGAAAQPAAHARDMVLTIRGTKLLAWKPFHRRLWDALLELPFTLECEGSVTPGELVVDLRYLAQNLPQLQRNAHTPALMTGIAGLGLLFMRAVFTTSFWEFGAPEYPKAPIERPRRNPPLRIYRSPRPVEPQPVAFSVPLSSAPDAPRIPLRLTHYPNPGRPPVLLIHGLAQGSLIFVQDMLDHSMAGWLHDQRYDIWVLDYRLSNVLDAEIPPRGWSMDELGEFDIPEAIRRVYLATGQPIRLFAHCVGATAAAMAILAGRIPRHVHPDGSESSVLHCVVFNAIHPWIVPSTVNGFRARLGTFFRDVLGNDPLDPIPSPRPGATEALLDRLAHSLARHDEEAGAHHVAASRDIENAVCDRMTLLYGRMWHHDNLDRRTHRFFPQLVGSAPGEVYRHLYYLLLKGRVCDREGQNVYLLEQNLNDHWDIPTLFLHGEESRVFNPQSARRSANRLSQVVNEPNRVAQRGGRTIPVASFSVPDYGHMDVIFAKTAAITVFPKLRAFFAEPEVPEWDDKELDPHSRPILALSCGPIVRASWREGAELRVRLWGEGPVDATSLTAGLEFTSHDALRLGMVNPGGPGSDQRHELVDIAVSAPADVAFDLRAKASATGVGFVVQQLPPAAAPAAMVAHGRRAYEWEAKLAWLQRMRSEAITPEMRFLVGSCRYPGTPFEIERSDAVFGGMLTHLVQSKQHPGVHMQFLIGDQIYADATANILDPYSWRERFSERYRAAFTTGHLHDLLRQLPTHFAIDDHEIADDWSGSGGSAKEQTEWEHAVTAASGFMGSGRDQRPIPSTAGRHPSALWYALDHQAERCFPTFVMDTRSERDLRHAAKGDTPKLIFDDQLDALAQWLTDAPRNLPKFVVSGSCIGPLPRAMEGASQLRRSHDGWLGYPATLAAVASILIEHDIEHVVFVGGDLHISAVARLRFASNGRSVQCHQLVASGLYAPLPFANAKPRDYRWGTPVAARCTGAGRQVDIECESFLLCAGRANFMRVDVEPGDGANWNLGFAVCDEEGAVAQPEQRPPGRPQDWAIVDAGGAWSVPLRSVRR